MLVSERIKPFKFSNVKILWEDNNESKVQFQWSNIRGSETIYFKYKKKKKTIVVNNLLLFVVKCSLVLTALEDLDNTITKVLSFKPDKYTAGLQPILKLKS